MSVLGQIASTELCVPTREPLRIRLERNRRDTHDKLNKLDQAIKFLDNHPEFENFHDLIGAVGF